MRTVVENGVEYVVVEMTWDSASADAMKGWNQGDTVDEMLSKITPDYEEKGYDEIRATVERIMGWPSWYYAPEKLVTELIDRGIITRDEYNASIEKLEAGRRR